MTTFFVLAFIAIFIFAAISGGNANIDKFEKQFHKKTSDLLNSGTYVSGHPKLDISLKETRLLLNDDVVKIFTVDHNGFTFKANIDKVSITNVAMEDSSTIQNRVTVGRLLLTGIFAFAWKKKTKQECAYFIIEWNQGQFKNETIFEFEGTGSIQKANTLRNKFIIYLSTETKTVQKENVYIHEQSIGSNQYTNYEQDLIYLDLLSKDRKLEAVNLFMHNNKVKNYVAMEYIQSLVKKD